MFVYPGKFVGTAEEFIPSHGLYEEDGKIYSNATGELELDAKNHTAKVIFKTRIPKLQGVKTITYGVVADVSKQVAVVDLVPAKSKTFEFVPAGISAVLHISNIRRGYVDSFETELKIGDILRVAIIEAEPHTMRLTVDGQNLGVVLAYCSKCRNRMNRKGYEVECPKCGSVEKRKLTADYGGVVE